MYISTGMGDICFPLSYGPCSSVMLLFEPTNIITVCVFFCTVILLVNIRFDQVTGQKNKFFFCTIEPLWTSYIAAQAPLLGQNVCLNITHFLKKEKKKDVCYMWVTLALSDIHNSK